MATRWFRPAARRPVTRFLPQYLAISPYYLVFTLFTLAPVAFSLYLSFQHWDGLGPMTFVGLRQYEFLFSDPVFWLSLTNTVIIWVLATVPMLFLALVVAALVNSTKRFTGFYRVALFIPSITSLVAIAIFFGAVFSNDFGLVNSIMQAVGLPRLDWLSNPWLIKVVIAALMTWQWTGYNAIIFLAGMQAIPGELYEAATVDGSGAVRSFFSITIPLLRPIILFTVVISTINGLQSFTEPQVLFGSNDALNPDFGGPGRAGLTTMLYFFQQAFDDNDYGYAAAIVWVLFVLIALFTVLNWRFVRGRRR